MTGYWVDLNRQQLPRRELFWIWILAPRFSSGMNALIFNVARMII